MCCTFTNIWNLMFGWIRFVIPLFLSVCEVVRADASRDFVPGCTHGKWSAKVVIYFLLSSLQLHTSMYYSNYSNLKKEHYMLWNDYSISSAMSNYCANARKINLLFSVLTLSYAIPSAKFSTKYSICQILVFDWLMYSILYLIITTLSVSNCFKT